MIRAILAGITYFFVVFAFASLLGIIRTVFVEPYVGDITAIVIELPIILTFSWVVCQKLVDRFQVKLRFFHRLTMGAIAFGLLLLAELSLAVLLNGYTPNEFLANLQTFPGLLGLAAQGLFGLFPILEGSLNTE